VRAGSVPWPSRAHVRPQLPRRKTPERDHRRTVDARPLKEGTCDTEALSDDRDILLTAASNAVEELENYGVDPLSVELVLAMLVAGHDLDIG
jgi:hypothetical protein